MSEHMQDRGNTQERYTELAEMYRRYYAETAAGLERQLHRRPLLPATEEQLQETEEQLGFLIPPLLRLLYKEVANGGLALGDIVGAAGGCTYGETAGDDESDGETLGHLVSHSDWSLDERVVAALELYPKKWILYPYDDRPDGFIFIQDRGCSITVELDGRTGCVFQSEPYFDAVAADGALHSLRAARLIAPSVEEWLGLDRKRGTTPDTAQGQLAGEDTDGPLTPDLLTLPISATFAREVRNAIQMELDRDEPIHFEDGAWHWYRRLDQLLG